MPEIPRLTTADAATIAQLMAQGSSPLIVTDATAPWPARGKWKLSYFAREFGDQFGVIMKAFSDECAGKATTLGKFIAGMDKPLSRTPGFWLDKDGVPTGSEPEEEDPPVWSFGWRPFEVAPWLRQDLVPYPPAIPNIVAGLDDDIRELLENLAGFDFHSIYISRAGTITPLHADHSHSFGSLAQFDGTKLVILYHPKHADGKATSSFNPEAPDYAAYPEMKEAQQWSAVLEPGDLLIILPDWLHYTRALQPSVTLSHNFFNQFNFSSYMRVQIQTMEQQGRSARLAKAIARLAQGAASA